MDSENLSILNSSNFKVCLSFFLEPLRKLLKKYAYAMDHGKLKVKATSIFSSEVPREIIEERFFNGRKLTAKEIQKVNTLAGNFLRSTKGKFYIF